MTPVRLEPAASRSPVKHSTNEPLHPLVDIKMPVCPDTQMYIEYSIKPCQFSVAGIKCGKKEVFIELSIKHRVKVKKIQEFPKS